VIDMLRFDSQAFRPLRVLLFIAAMGLLVAGPALAQEESSAAAKRKYSAAAQLQNENLFDLAAKEWREFIAAYPKDPLAPSANHYLGVCLIQLKKNAEAVEVLAAHVKANPKFALRDESLLNLAAAQYSLAGAADGTAEFAKPAATYEQLIKEYPESKFLPNALFYLGESYYTMQKYDEAAAAYARQVKEFPEDGLRQDALYALGITQLLQKKPKEAETTFDTFLKEFPESQLATQISLNKADALYDQEQYAAAEKLYATTAAIKGFAQADRALLQQANCLSNQKKNAEAAAMFAELTKTFPQSSYVPEATRLAGTCYHLAGNNEEAIAWLAKVEGADAPTAAHWLARAQLALGKPAEALAAVEKVLPAANDKAFYVDLLMDQADALNDIPARRKEAIPLYAALAKDHPQHAKAASALYYAAWASYDTGQPAEALKYVEAYLKDHADHELVSAAKSVAGDAYLATGAYANADATFRDLLEKYADNPSAERWKLMLGWSLYRQKKYADTVSALEPAVESIKAPELKSEALFLTGSSHFSLKAFDKAQAALQQSLAANPKSGIADNTMLLLSRAQRLLNDVKGAQATARKLIADFPNSEVLDRAHYYLAEYLYSDGQYKEAAATYNTLLEKWPESTQVPAALYWLGWSDILLNEPATAIDALSKLIADHADDELAGPARFARGKAYRLSRKNEEAVKDLDAYLATNPAQKDKSAALLERGLAQIDLKQYAAATESFQAILADDAKFASADKVKYNLAWALKDDGKNDEAVKIFAQLAADHPDSPFAGEGFYHVGQKEYEDKEYAKAAASYTTAREKAAAAGENDIAELAAHKLGWSLWHQDDFKKAHDVFADQVKSFAQGDYVKEGRFMQAECLYKQDDFENALAAYQQVQAAPPASKDFQLLALLHGGQAAAALAKWDDSLKMLEECQTQFPDSPSKAQILYDIGWAKKNTGMLDEAEKLFAEVTALTANKLSEVGCRAQLLLGDIQFEKKMHTEAIREYFKVFRGYKGAPKSFDKWKAQATYEAARCFEVLKQVANAKKYYQEVVDNYPDSAVVGKAKERLAAL
jgi:TolA-binding protein